MFEVKRSVNKMRSAAVPWMAFLFGERRFLLQGFNHLLRWLGWVRLGGLTT